MSKLRGEDLNVLVRMPPQLKDAIKSKAKSLGVSANSLIVNTLYEGIGGFEKSLVAVKFEERWRLKGE